MKYLFYDLETSGLDKSFDQILQFGAILTDSNFNILKEYNYKVELRQDIAPHPEAILTTRIQLENHNSNYTDYSIAGKIHKLFNQPNTINIGYNSLGFDDSFLRFSFYRNLLEPYTHQFLNDCMRADVLPILIRYFIYAPEAIKFPVREGKTSFKLEEINKLNGFCKGQAHDALVDVKITLELAKRLFQFNSRLWSQSLSLFNKKQDITTTNLHVRPISVLGPKVQLGIYVDIKIGAKNNFIAPILLLGKDQFQRIKYLRLDNADLTLEPDSLDKIYTKKFGEPGFIYAYDNITTKFLGEERVDLLEKNLQWIEKNKYLLVQIMTNLEQSPNFFQDCDIDSKLYINGFWTVFEKQDINLAHEFIKKVDDNDFQYILPKFPKFNYKDIESVFYRILIRNFPGFSKIYLFHEKEKLLYDFYSNRVIQMDYLGLPKRKPQEVIKIINLLYRSKREKEDRKLLKQLKYVLLDKFKEFHPIEDSFNPVILEGKTKETIDVEDDDLPF